MAGERKAKVTEVHKAEAERLSALWENRPGEKLNQTLFGERYEIGGQSAVGQFLRGETPLSMKAARGFVRGFNDAGHLVTLGDISPRLAAEANANVDFVPTLTAEEAALLRSYRLLQPEERPAVLRAAGVTNSAPATAKQPEQGTKAGKYLTGKKKPASGRARKSR